MPKTNKKKNISSPPILIQQTQKLIKEIESVLGHPLITLWNHPNGSINQNSVAALYEVVKQLNNAKNISFFIKSSGGTGRASLRMIDMLRQKFDAFDALLPLNCASAATMLALGANQIYMGPLAYLTPIDTSITHDLSPVDADNDEVSVSQIELSRVIKLWNQEKRKTDMNPYANLYNYVHPLVIGAVDRASELSTKLCERILSYHIHDKKKATHISNQLNSGYPSHNYPITKTEARELGLNVKELPNNLNSLLLELNELYSEMGQNSITDFDEFSYHSNDIVIICETAGIQLIYQRDKEWHFKKDERRWVTLNDNSNWHRIKLKNNKPEKTVFYLQ